MRTFGSCWVVFAYSGTMNMCMTTNCKHLLGYRIAKPKFVFILDSKGEENLFRHLDMAALSIYGETRKIIFLRN